MIYFIQAGHDGPIKIGVTGSEVSKRLRAIQTTAPHTLSLLGQVPGNRSQESAVHRKLSASLIRGEWFSPTPEVRAFIDSVLTANSLPPDLEAKLSSRAMRVMFVVDTTDPDAVDPMEIIAEAVKEAGSHSAFAAKCGISQPYFSQILNGKRPMTSKLLEAVGLERKVVISYHRKAKVPA